MYMCMCVCILTNQRKKISTVRREPNLQHTHAYIRVLGVSFTVVLRIRVILLNGYESALYFSVNDWGECECMVCGYVDALGAGIG